MPCYHPIDAFRTPGGEIKFSKQHEYAWVEKLRLSCGQCVGCRLERSRQWATRCIHEASLYEKNCFITLTYDDEHLPGTNGVGTLHYPDFQKFLKRLRKRFPRATIRYYMAGEYGTTFGRPHFHACIFGFDFDDKVLWKRTSANSMLYRSKILESLWPFGYSSIGDVTFESAAYVARYIMKKVTGDDSEKHYQYCDLSTGELIQLEPEFNRMSLKPGIGAGWLEKYAADVYPHDYVEVRGHKCTPPSYYDKLIQKNDAYKWYEILDRRKKRAKLNPEEKTRERLLVKETVRLAKTRKLQKEIA
jgi:hypothetical protein